jgi:hypothetical protein
MPAPAHYPRQRSSPPQLALRNKLWTPSYSTAPPLKTWRSCPAPRPEQAMIGPLDRNAVPDEVKETRHDHGYRLRNCHRRGSPQRHLALLGHVIGLASEISRRVWLIILGSLPASRMALAPTAALRSVSAVLWSSRRWPGCSGSVMRISYRLIRRRTSEDAFVECLPL